MTEVFRDRVMENCTTAGTGVLTLLGTSATAGFRTFASVCSSNDTFPYSVWTVDANGNANGDWESGIGTYGNSTITRTSVYDSSSSGAAVNFAAGTKYVAIAQIASRTPYFSADADIIFPSSTYASPGTPGLGSTAIFGTKFAGRGMFAQKNDYGGVDVIQNSFGYSAISMYQPIPGGTTLAGQIGLALASTGTGTARFPATTNAFTRFRRIGLTSNAAVSTSVSVINPSLTWTTGNTGQGGFFAVMRFGIVDAAPASQTSTIFYAGMVNFSTTPVVTTAATLKNCAVVYCDSTFATSSLRLNVSGSSTQTFDLSTNFANATNNMGIELTVYAPGATTGVMNVQVKNMNTNFVTSFGFSGASSVVPQYGTYMTPAIYRTTNTVSSGATPNIDLVSIYIENSSE